MKVKFKHWECDVNIGIYPNGQTLIRLTDSEDSAPIAIGSVSIPDCELEDDEVLIKSWSENVGMRKALIDAGVIGPIIEYIPTGWVLASKHKLLKQ